MARKLRLARKELYHHIYAWGNDRHPIFKSEAHYEKYLEYLTLYTSCHNVGIIAYALMQWHIHLFVFDSTGQLSQFMNNLHGQYAQFYNKVAKRVGHVFGGRFNNKIVQINNYGLWLSRYINRQAVEAGIVDDPKDYPWTSYRTYIGLGPRGFLKPWIILNQFGHGELACRRYEEFVLNDEDGPVNWAAVSESVIGDDEFIENITSSKDSNKENELHSENLIEAVSAHLQVNPKSLMNPRGRAERRLRHKAFVILADRYGLSATRVAQTFKISPTAVVKALKK